MAFHLRIDSFQNSEDINFYFYYKNNISLGLTIYDIVLSNGIFVSGKLSFSGSYSNDPVTGIPHFSSKVLPISDRPFIYQDLVFFKKEVLNGVVSFFIDCFDPEFFLGYSENAFLSELINFSVPDVASSFPSSFLVAPPVDLASIHSSLDALNTSISEVRLQSDVLASVLIGESSSVPLVSLSDILSKIEALDLQVPDNLATQLSSLSSQIDAIDLTPLSSISLPESLTGLTPIDITNLGGNFCKFVTNDLVFYGLYGIWQVLKASLVFVTEDMLTPVYYVRQNIAAEGLAPEYRYNTVPQSALSLYVPPKTVTVP